MGLPICKKCKKTILPNRGKAGAALRSMKERFGYKGRIYYCSFCDGYHIGRPKQIEMKKHGHEY